MKQDLHFKKPFMNAAGTLGFIPNSRADFDLSQLGAFVTNPISIHRRFPSVKPVCMKYDSGFLLHTGLPNPGFESTLKRFARQWTNSDLPVIVHVMPGRPDETRKMVQVLESIENVMALELGFSPLLTDDLVLLVIEECPSEIPLIVSISNGQLLRIGGHLLELGVAAITLAQPRGALGSTGKQQLIEGRLFGPGLFPQNLALVHAASRMGLPIIGAGGVWYQNQAQVMLEAGALAVQIDARLWVPKNKDPVK